MGDVSGIPPFIPADAGIQPLPDRTTSVLGKDWVPASAGTNGWIGAAIKQRREQ
jgi:hypothetical protein